MALSSELQIRQQDGATRRINNNDTHALWPIVPTAVGVESSASLPNYIHASEEARQSLSDRYRWETCVLCECVWDELASE